MPFRQQNPEAARKLPTTVTRENRSARPTPPVAKSPAPRHLGGRPGMGNKTHGKRNAKAAGQSEAAPDIPGQVVLVFQGGGALGAYQAGVYQAMHDRKVKPDWVIGTSIGAINGAIIAGNPPENRIARLTQFWNGVARRGVDAASWLLPGLTNW